jgi:hypothetical protein
MLDTLQFRKFVLFSKNIRIKISKTVILPAVLYVCKTLSLALLEEHRLRMFVNMVLRRIFGSKRDGIIGSWRKLCNEGVHNLYCSPHIIRNQRFRM